VGALLPAGFRRGHVGRTSEEALAAAKICFKYLRPGGYLRIAVPDGLHPDPAYIEVVRPEAEIPNDHKVLYTYKTLRELFERSGFQVRLYEYFDEAGTFHCRDWDQKAGTIWRSKRFDPRNGSGKLVSVYPGTLEDYLSYSSIILDAVREGTPRAQESQSGARALTETRGK
jgi:predicted SAM-dependent methyltransferase